jgi:shikimate kinase
MNHSHAVHRRRASPTLVGALSLKPSTSNLVLIGMPGAGKSTVGVILAKQTSRAFIDTDVLIQTTQGRSLQDVVDTEGYVKLREIEEQVLLGISVTHCVIATGGSAVYSEPAMAHLQSDSCVIFLHVDLATIGKRVHDFSARGLAKRPEQSIADLFVERCTLYTKYADYTIRCDDRTHEEVCYEIMAATGYW